MKKENDFLAKILQNRSTFGQYFDTFDENSQRMLYIFVKCVYLKNFIYILKSILSTKY